MKGHSSSAEKLAAACASGVAAAYLLWLVWLFVQNHWLLDRGGHPLVTDFLGVWSAGWLAERGAASSAYSGLLQHAAQVEIIRHPFPGALGWPYPPSYLFVALGLAKLGYLPGFLVFMGATGTLFAAAVRTISRERLAVLLALAAPWTFANVMVGQNGMLTAGLLGFGLVLLERRPVLAGVLLGLLSYKPQFGVVVPLALICGGEWRAFWSAAATVALVLLSSVLAFGTDAMDAFLVNLPMTAHTLLDEGAVGWAKLQSVYGAIRWAGATNLAAMAGQAFVTLSCAGVIGFLWRGAASPARKAAALVCAALLCTPYVFLYDLPALVIALAFLYRERTFDQTEILLIAVALGASAAFAAFPAPMGLVSTIAVAAIVARRTVLELQSQAAIIPSAS